MSRKSSPKNPYLIWPRDSRMLGRVPTSAGRWRVRQSDRRARGNNTPSWGFLGRRRGQSPDPFTLGPICRSSCIEVVCLRALVKSARGGWRGCYQSDRPREACAWHIHCSAREANLVAPGFHGTHQAPRDILRNMLAVLLRPTPRACTRRLPPAVKPRHRACQPRSSTPSTVLSTVTAGLGPLRPVSHAR